MVLALFLAVLVAISIALCLCKMGSREDGLPPGPPTVPIFGNILMFPTEFPHFKITEWARQYGGVYSLKMGTSTAIVLTDIAAVKELMDRRGATTVDRPPTHVIDVATGGLHLALVHYNETWKTMRKAAHAILTPQASSRHLPIQKAEAIQLLHDIISSPHAFYTHIERYSASAILSVIYGKRAIRYEAPEIKELFQVVHQFELLMEPGATPPVDMIPILKLVPERWAKWKRDCRKIRKRQRAMFFGLLNETILRLRQGEKNGSYMEEVLEREEELGLTREMTAYMGGSLTDAASETTSSYIHSFIVALLCFPDAQRKAHEEIDRVVGKDRMPTLDDLEDMPYIRAVILETHRFRPAAPLLIPHATTAMEEYQGYIIPKGASIFVNVWGILHDPALYDNPEDFIPDRYLLTENGTKPGVDGSDVRHNLPFGVGRRACPGIHQAQNSIKLNVMNLLWAFTFDTVDGESIKPDSFGYKQGLGVGPMLFSCKISPRTAEKAAIVERELIEAEDIFLRFEFGLSPEDQEFVAKSRVRSQ